MIFRRLLAAMLSVLCLAPALMPTMPIVAAPECESGSQYFPATNRCVGATFYAYWQSHGGLAQQGLPITDEIREVSPIDGKTYTVQYFERARFEHHPEQADPQYRVLLGLLGLEQYKDRYPNGAPPRGGQCTAGEQFFEETRHCVSALFYTYWQSHGGLAQQGLPLSDPFIETNPTDGKRYLTQYFERARFEHHPKNPAPYNVLLGLLGREQAATKPGKALLVVEKVTLQVEMVTLQRVSRGNPLCWIGVTVRNEEPDAAQEVKVEVTGKSLAPPSLTWAHTLQGPAKIAAGTTEHYSVTIGILFKQGDYSTYAVTVRSGGTVVATKSSQTGIACTG